MRKKFPLLTPNQWELYTPTVNSPNASPWGKTWKAIHALPVYIPSTYYILWWRLLHSNLMTAHRTSHFIPGLSSMCAHCHILTETPYHLFFECLHITPFWNTLLPALPALPPAPGPTSSPLPHILFLPAKSPQVPKPVLIIIGCAIWTIHTVHWKQVFDNIPLTQAGLKEQFQSTLSYHFLILERQARSHSIESLTSLRDSWNIPLFSTCNDKGLHFLQPP